MKTKTKKPAAEKPAMPKEPITQTTEPLPIRLSLDMERFSSGALSMTIGDTFSEIGIGKGAKRKVLGHVVGCLGGGIEIAVGKRHWRLSPLDLWKAVQEADKDYRIAARESQRRERTKCEHCGGSPEDYRELRLACPHGEKRKTR